MLLIAVLAVPETFAGEPDSPGSAGQGPRAMMQAAAGAIQKEYQAVEDTLQKMTAEEKILQPDDFQEAMWALKQAVQSGEASRERLDASVRRIIIAKGRIMRTMGDITNS